MCENEGTNLDGGFEMELGITTFVETTPDVKTGHVISHAERLRQVVEEIKLADEVGLDVYGVGEHHRADYAASSPTVVLAAASTQTNRIKLTSAVTVLSSADPVRVYEEFATLDGLSNGRAEIMAGRGSFVESFPLFGYDLADYNELFDEKLQLLLNIQQNEFVTHEGKFRPSIQNRAIYPRPVQKEIPIWIASGGTPSSSVRAGQLGLPLTIAILGGNPLAFSRVIDLYRQTGLQAGHNESKLKVAINSHGYIARTKEEAVEKFFPSTQAVMNKLGRERGWPPYTMESFEYANSFDGAVYAGDPETIAQKILLLHEHLGIDRFFLQTPVGTMPHEDVLQSIRLFGEEVAPIVRAEVAKRKK